MVKRAAMILGASCLWLCDVDGLAAQSTFPALTIRLYTEADVRAPWLPEARLIVERIFADASVRVGWIDCTSMAQAACDGPPDPNMFVVRIRRQSVNRPAGVCGLSLRPERLPGQYVTLFADCIEQGAGQLHMAEAVPAAYSLAHEIGHLLLPIGHAPSGIMRARPDRVDLVRAAAGSLTFRRTEVRQMRAALQHRLASSLAARER